MKMKRIMLPLVVIMIVCACGTIKRSQKQNMTRSATSVSTRDTGKVLAPVAYNKLITSKAITQHGLFTVHQVDDKWYFEIPDSLLNRDILIVNRISKAAAENRPMSGMLGYAGDQIGQNVIQFSKGAKNKVFIKRMSYRERSYDSTANGLYWAVKNSNLDPIVTGFDIKTFAPDSVSFVIDVTDFFNGDNSLLFFDPEIKKNFNLGDLQKEKSYINAVLSFPLNIELKTVKTYGTENKAFTFELNSSIVLLPKQPMTARYADERIGYFAQFYLDFDKKPQTIDGTAMITRWRLEPKAEDEEKYKKGILVEPQKPIVFYIDPATPKKWVPYLIQGVNDWQMAFEKAGFKNAIYAMEVPKNDSNWSLEDARHNVIVYKASPIANASGPNIHDPRTGEILESHINWYHNVMALVHDWYMIQAGPLDPRARKMEFEDSLMGQLIRFVSCHEVGHTLGLMHNFGASSTIPTDSLRNKHYLEANGFCPSIMDYARFNYVAQPEDSISEKGIFPRIGAYDEWAINWGYRWLPQYKTPKEESIYLKQWITTAVSADKRLWFGNEISSDPRCRAEDLGDDPIKASRYGIANLKRVMEGIKEWTYEPGENYFYLKRLQAAAVDQYKRYVGNVTTLIAGYYYTPKLTSEKGNIFQIVPADLQKRAFQFVNEEIFNTPHWLDGDQLIWFTGMSNGRTLLQDQVLSALISNGRLMQMCTVAKSSYTTSDFLDDCKKAIWKELLTHKPITEDRRNLQRMHVNTLQNIFSKEYNKDNGVFENYAGFVWNLRTDVPMLVRNQLEVLVNEINKALPGYKDKISITHLKNMSNIIKQFLDAKNSNFILSQTTNNKSINFDSFKEGLNIDYHKMSSYAGCDMWEANE